MDDEQSLKLILQTTRSTHAELIMPLMEKQTKIISGNLQAFNGICILPPLPEYYTLELVINKYDLSKWLLESGFSNTRPVTLRHLTEGESNPDNLTYPLLIKPFWGSSGEGIIRINEASQLRSIVEAGVSPAEILIQPYFAGHDLDLSALVKEGRIIVHTMQRPAVKNRKFKYSKKIEFTEDAGLFEFCEKIFKKLNYSGIAHLDFRHDPEKNTYHLVDFNARYWSTITGSMIAGINFPHLACQVARNVPIEPHLYKRIRFLSSESLFYILFNSFSLNRKSLHFLVNNELYYGLGDPIPMFFNFITLLRAKIEWHFLRGKRNLSR